MRSKGKIIKNVCIWHNWFAWHPLRVFVQLPNEAPKWVWVFGEYLDRKWSGSWDHGSYEYRLKGA